MRKKVIVFMILCVCANMPAMAVSYNIGSFTAPKGADGTNGINGTNGTDCRPTETRTRCYGTGSDKCADSTRSGVKIVTTQCDGSGPTTSYIYDNNCGITVASTTDVHQDNDTTKPVTHKRVTFKNTCTDETLSTTADVPVGCTPTYTQKYINKETNGSFTYNNDSRGENTIGARVIVSGCGNDNSFDTYDGNDGTSFNYKGSVANCGALNSVSNPSQNDAYIVNGDGNGKLCIYNGSSWPTCPSGCAEFTGPAGASNCTDFETSTTAVKNTFRTYSGPSDSTTSGGVTFYATRGKTVLTHKMCNTSLNDTVDNENDTCVPIIAPNGVTCNGTYMECKRGDNSTTYNVCEATTGDSISNALDPCAGNTNSSTIIKTTSTTAYSRGTKTNGVYSAIGKKTVTKTACNGDAYTTDEQDDCIEVAKPSGKCAAATSAYLRCYNAQASSDKTYYVCQDLGMGNNSLANKIDGKMDINASINISQLPNTVVITGNSGSNSIEKLLETEIDNTNGVFKDFVTGGDLTTAVSAEVESRLDTAISEKNVTFGGVSMTLDEALELLGAAAGTCTRGSLGGADGTVSCSGGGLGSVSTTGKD